MSGKEKAIKDLEEKKIEMQKLTNELLSLYRKLLEEKIDYKNENKYDDPISKQREKIVKLEKEIREAEKKVKKSDIKKIEKRIKEYSKKREGE